MRRGSNILEIFQGVQGATCFSSCLYTVRKNMLQPASVPAYTLLEKICFNLLQFLPIHCQKKYVATCFSSCLYTVRKRCCSLNEFFTTLLEKGVAICISLCTVRKKIFATELSSCLYCIHSEKKRICTLNEFFTTLLIQKKDYVTCSVPVDTFGKNVATSF